MKVYTTVGTLKNAWEILDEVGLSGLVFGSPSSEPARDIVNGLFEQSALVRFLQVITRDSQTDFEEIEIEDAMRLVTDFFGRIGGALRQVAAIGKAKPVDGRITSLTPPTPSGR